MKKIIIISILFIAVPLCYAQPVSLQGLDQMETNCHKRVIYNEPCATKVRDMRIKTLELCIKYLDIKSKGIIIPQDIQDIMSRTCGLKEQGK